MLTHVVVHQPEDPIAYFHEELSRIKKEVEENNVSLRRYCMWLTCVVYYCICSSVVIMAGTVSI